uniref:Uncharacterized protein n=1 Tax=Arundo donax TaxID=35708 RepID=A0A0A8ZQ58_ARUDO
MRTNLQSKQTII